MLALGLFLLLSLCTKYLDEIRAFQEKFQMTLFVVYKWVLTFGYVDRESCVKEAWQGNERGRREKKNKEREQNRELEMKLLIELGFKIGFVLLVPIFHFPVPCARFHPLNPKIKI